MLGALERHAVRYLVIGGLAVIFHAKPRYTRDMDLWIDSEPGNVERANAALGEFGSPLLLDSLKPDEIVQLGVEPTRIDFLLAVEGEAFAPAWNKRIRGQYGHVTANWIDLETLIHIKSRIDNPCHQEDARLLREVLKRRMKRTEPRL